MYHVINRGNYRRDLFVSPGEAKAFLETELINKQRPDPFSAPTQLPWFAWGHSAGGQWAFGLANVYPERTAAFIAIKGGIYETPSDSRARMVPGLFVIGEGDEIRRAISITGLYERERRAGACWALAWEAQAGYEVGKTLGLCRAYFQEVALLRLAAAPGAALRPPGEATGWIGNRADYQKVNASRLSPEQLPRTVWLPGPESGKRWSELGQRSSDAIADEF